MNNVTSGKLNVAVVGSGISGLSAAWLLSQSHNVTLYEKDDRPGGHSNTVDAGDTPVDTVSLFITPLLPQSLRIV